MKSGGLTVIFFLLSCYQGSSQQYFYNEKYYDGNWLLEVGIHAGFMNCFTDIGGRKGEGKFFIKDLNIRNTQPALGAGIRLLHHYSIGINLEFIQGSVSAYDSILRKNPGNARSRYQRNLHFKSRIQELSLTAEWHFGEQFGFAKGRLSPYLTAGIGMFRFNPKAKLGAKWIALQPLHTEGQGFKEYPRRNNYQLTQINIPAGLGIKYEVSALWILRFEVVHRFLFTDYLDDVSTHYIESSLFAGYLSPGQAQYAYKLADRRKELDPYLLSRAGEKRGNPRNNDSYFTVSLKAGLLLNRKRR